MGEWEETERFFGRKSITSALTFCCFCDISIFNQMAVGKDISHETCWILRVPLSKKLLDQLSRYKRFRPLNLL